VRVEKTDVYREWIDRLKDRAGRARILVRVDRLIHGNPGQHRELTEGVSELKIDFGPGYRVYYAQRGTRLLLLLAGGDKSTQQKDIARAIELVKNFKEQRVMPKTAAKKPTRTKTTPYDVAEHLRTPEEMAAYLDAWLEEAPDNAAGIARALGDIARAKGMTQVAKDAGLSRESLYRALSAEGNPSFATVLKVARALGLKLHAEAA
jgi:putative addiction module killer protein/probable addiction module antidote protein